MSQFTVGWAAYQTLRSDLAMPRQAVSQHYALIPALAERIGDKIHWLGIKKLDENCHVPCSAAEPDELRCFQSVYHYGDNFAPMITWVNKLPVRNRFQASCETHFDFNELKYPVPHLDICIVQSTGQIGGAWATDYLLRLIYAKNPNVGFIVHDQDLCCSTTFAKMKKWHPNWEERCIVTTNYLARSGRFFSQAPAMSPHLPTKRLTPSIDGNTVCYVGNDYKRRERMMTFLGYPGCHLHGTMNPRDATERQVILDDWYSFSGEEFARRLCERGCAYHGPFKPSINWSIEDCYHQHGAGLCITREDAYRINYYGCRPSEIARAGTFAFWDNKLAIAYPLGGQFACVSNGAEMLQRLAWLQENRQYWLDAIDYQWQSLLYYTSVERYVETFYQLALRLLKGPVKESFELNLYGDLMEAAGLRPWGATL